MIGVIFDFSGEIVEIRIDNNTCLFRTNNQLGGAWATIEGIRLDKKGVIREHPDLENREDWKEEAIKRFKEKISKMNEIEKMNYLINDMSKFGYIPLYKQRSGFRPEKIK